ncbi:MAG TPA: hydroxymethylbilane synthase [Bacteroidota bacterium]|nr:hydroxymethylbilane synthase [Bacteroidota bacterium]
MTSSRKLTIGTRGSDLALWQTTWVAAELRRLYPDISLTMVTIKTTGDKILDSPLSKIGDKGLFTKEIEHALLDRTIDLAVHSLKDVPTNISPGLAITAVTEREDVRDVFISHPAKGYGSFQQVPGSGTIATGSLRRRCQILNRRPDLRIADIRGNLKTRRTKLENSEWDGMILAKAGVTRLGWTEIISEVLPPEVILPAVGQGALAIETREGDEAVSSLLRPLEHAATRLSTNGERALLRRLEGGCQIPIGTFGRIEKGEFVLDAMVGSLDGKRAVRSSIHGLPGESERLGTQLAESLLAEGADEILDEIRKTTEG